MKTICIADQLNKKTEKLRQTHDGIDRWNKRRVRDRVKDGQVNGHICICVFVAPSEKTTSDVTTPVPIIRPINKQA